LRRALELIDLFALGGFRDKLVRELSTGTRRIVDIACVLTQGPSVVMLDEPSSGIAQREAEALGPLLRQVRDGTGCALLLIEHDMPLLLGLAERVYALETGRVIAEGGPGEVVHHPEVILSYLGADPAAIRRSGAVEGGVARPTKRSSRATGRAPARTRKVPAKAPAKRVAGRKRNP
jgi:branched-chain amino acid transport system ATP-binding protein